MEAKTSATAVQQCTETHQPHTRTERLHRHKKTETATNTGTCPLVTKTKTETPLSPANPVPPHIKTVQKSNPLVPKRAAALPPCSALHPSAKARISRRIQAGRNPPPRRRVLKRDIKNLTKTKRDPAKRRREAATHPNPLDRPLNPCHQRMVPLQRKRNQSTGVPPRPSTTKAPSQSTASRPQVNNPTASLVRNMSHPSLISTTRRRIPSQAPTKHLVSQSTNSPILPPRPEIGRRFHPYLRNPCLKRRPPQRRVIKTSVEAPVVLMCQQSPVSNSQMKKMMTSKVPTLIP